MFAGRNSVADIAGQERWIVLGKETFEVSWTVRDGEVEVRFLGRHWCGHLGLDAVAGGTCCL